MNPLDLKHFSDLLKARSGIELDAQKEYLVNSRLSDIAATAGHPSVDALLAAMRTAPVEAVLEAAVDAMTTNETFFFRDQTPFNHLRQILVEPARRRASRIRIWSAACSTGQEPYSIAMVWDELAHHLPGVRLEILATDLSPTCLQKARTGLYSQFEVQRGLPVQKLMKHFTQEGPNWQVKPDLRAAIDWRRFNLLDSPRAHGSFDVVFCRNVLIYFDRETRSRILSGIADQLAPDGYLMLGAAETVLGLSNAFRPAPGGEPGLYVKSEGAAMVGLKTAAG